MDVLGGMDYLQDEGNDPTIVSEGVLDIDFASDDLEPYDAYYFSEDYFASVESEPEGVLVSPNADLAGDVHSVSGVPYETNTVLTDEWVWKEGVFPVFDAHFEAVLPVSDYHAGSYAHQQTANEQLLWSYEQNPAQFEDWSDVQIEQLLDGETPEGFTWHHHEEMGRMQLVDSDLHGPSSHIGGMSVWGGGY